MSSNCQAYGAPPVSSSNSAGDVVLSLITRTAVSSTTSCLASAAGFVGLKLTGKTITLENCDISITDSKEYPSSCGKDDMATSFSNCGTNGELQKLLNDAIEAKAGAESAKGTFIDNITSAVSAQANTTCSAMATNSVFFHITAANDILINGCNIAEQAQAMVETCIHTVTVLDNKGAYIPLGIYVKNQIENSGDYNSVTDHTGKSVPALPAECAGPEIPKSATFAAAGLLAVVLLSYLTIIPGLILKHKKKH
jgi:hypothetical protein